MFAWLHAASGLSCLLSCRTTSQRITSSSQQLTVVWWWWWWLVVGGLFANSFLSKFSMLSMLYWESGSDDHISVCNYSWFMIPVLAPCPHQLQTHTVQFCFYPFPAGGGWLLCDFGSQCLALLQATTEGSITWNHEQLWWSQASEPCHHVAVMLAAVQIRKAVCLQCGHGGCCSAAGDNGKRQWSAY